MVKIIQMATQDWLDNKYAIRVYGKGGMSGGRDEHGYHFHIESVSTRQVLVVDFFTLELERVEDERGRKVNCFSWSDYTKIRGLLKEWLMKKDVVMDNGKSIDVTNYQSLAIQWNIENKFSGKELIDWKSLLDVSNKL